MNFTYRPNPNLSLSFQADGPLEAARVVCEYQDGLGQVKCGACDSPNVRLIRRTPKGYEFFAWECECGARLDLFSPKDSNQLFPSRKDKQGNKLDNGGWVKYQKPEQSKPAGYTEPDF